jgi:hypothetical protein
LAPLLGQRHIFGPLKLVLGGFGFVGRFYDDGARGERYGDLAAGLGLCVTVAIRPSKMRG